ncbi:MAG: dihydropteroate synthase [Peptococcaceae bacterium]
MENRALIKCGGYTLEMGKRTYIMGILNVTPDSFSDGGDFCDVEKAVEHAKELLAQGADIIDIGGESTRPGSEEVGAGEELARVLPVVKRLFQEVNVPISVDTYKAGVAEEVLKAGAHIINDVWGLTKDAGMAEVVARYQVPVILMHNQIGTEYRNDIMEEIKRFLGEAIKKALRAGVKKENIIIDPGIGFGKNPEQSMEVMARLAELQDLGYPVLLGTSRKSMLGKILDLPPKERVTGTVATTVLGITRGVDFVRVHDVQENCQAAQVTDAIIRGRYHG